MTTTLHRYRVPYARVVSIPARRGATILSVTLDGDVLVVDVKQDDDEPREPLDLRAVRPADTIRDDEEHLAVLSDGSHIYRTPEAEGADANTRLQARVKHLREVIKSERARVDVARTTAAALRASVDGMRRERDAAVEELAKVNSDATIMARNLEAAHERVDTLAKQARSSEIYGNITPSWSAYEALVDRAADATKRADRAEKIRADAVRALNAALSGVDNA